jgi:hypothetical protein
MSLELDRENTVQLLCRHYAQDRLTTEELDARLDAVYRAQNEGELRALLAGLDAVAMPVPLERTAVAEPESKAPDRRILAVFAEVKKRGDWELRPQTRAVVVFGSLELDLREARIAARVTTLDVSATFAEVKIIVPPGIRVECDGSAILGEFTEAVIAGPASGDVATVRVVGMAVLSSVSVHMRFPGETAKEAKRREKGR